MAPTPVIATRAYREDGELITTFDQLLPLTMEEYHQHQHYIATTSTTTTTTPAEEEPLVSSLRRRVYLVAEGLEFVWPFVKVGHPQVVSTNVVPSAYTNYHNPQDDNNDNNDNDNTPPPIILESMSDKPRVFRIHNFHTPTESTDLIAAALNATGDQRLKRSTVGSGTKEDGSKVAYEEGGRTSDNAWDMSSPSAKATIRRSFQLTNMKEDNGKVDGLQIVRYQPGQGYNTHPDYFTPKDDDDFDFLPYSGGSNRFATVFMYLNNVEEGGFTVFPRAPSIGDVQDPPPGALDMFGSRSWEHSMTQQCYQKLAVPPADGTAALFYSIAPDGQIDPSSHHGACPVTKGLKWGANIWLWNRQRYGEIRTGDPRELVITNDVQHPPETVYISWERRDSGRIDPGRSIHMNTFEFHRFQAHFESHTGPPITEYTIQPEPKDTAQTWSIRRPRVHSLQEQSSSSSTSPQEDEEEEGYGNEL